MQLVAGDKLPALPWAALPAPEVPGTCAPLFLRLQVTRAAGLVRLSSQVSCKVSCSLGLLIWPFGKRQQIVAAKSLFGSAVRQNLSSDPSPASQWRLLILRFPAFSSEGSCEDSVRCCRLGV